MASIMYNYVSFICHTMTHEPLNHIIHFPTITHKMTQISDPYKTGHLLVPSGSSPNIVILKHTTKPEGISPGIKTKPQHSLELPENSPENSIMTVQKQSRKFSPNCSKTVPKLSPDCPKTIPKISKNSYTQSKNLRTKIYSLSRSLSQFTTIKWSLG